MEDNDMSKFSNKSNHKGEQRNANMFIPDDLVREALQEKGDKLTPELADSLVGNATNYFLNVISIYKDLIAHDKNITTEALNVFQTLAQNPNLTEEQREIIEEAFEAQSAAEAEYATESYFCGIADCIRFLKYIEGTRSK